MGGIKPFIVFSVTSFYFTIMSWSKGTDQFVLDAVLHKMNLKNGRFIRTTIGTKTFGEFLPIISLDTLNRTRKSLNQMLKEQSGRIRTVLLKGFYKPPSGKFINGSILIETLPFCFVYKAN